MCHTQLRWSHGVWECKCTHDEAWHNAIGKSFFQKGEVARFEDMLPLLVLYIAVLHCMMRQLSQGPEPYNVPTYGRQPSCTFFGGPEFWAPSAKITRAPLPLGRGAAIPQTLPEWLRQASHAATVPIRCRNQDLAIIILLLYYYWAIQTLGSHYDLF